MLNNKCKTHAARLPHGFLKQLYTLDPNDPKTRGLYQVSFDPSLLTEVVNKKSNDEQRAFCAYLRV